MNGKPKKELFIYKILAIYPFFLPSVKIFLFSFKSKFSLKPLSRLRFR